MSDLTRAFASELEVRSEGDGRTVEGIVVPFERSARVSDGGRPYLESFRRGAFTKTLSERGNVKFLSQHQAGHNPLGRATMLEERADGLWGQFRVSETAAGNDALALIRDGALDSFSVGFGAVKHVREGEVTVRTEVKLREVSLVTFPAYEDARISAVRQIAADAGLDPEEAIELMRLLPTLRTATPPEPVELGTSTDAAPSDESPEALRSELTPKQQIALTVAAFRMRSTG